MKYKLILSGILSLMFSSVNAGSFKTGADSSKLPVEDPCKNNIKITPARFLLSHPGVMVSYERYFGKRFSTELSGALLYNINFVGNEPFPSTGSGYQLSLEEKYTLRPGKARRYVSMEAGYYNIVGNNYTESVNLYSNNSFVGDKRIYYMAPKVGLELHMSSHFIVETFVGVGVRYVEGKFTNLSDPTDVQKYEHWDVKVPMNIKLGLEF